MKEKKEDFIQIGRNIQSARKRAGFTQKQLSTAIDVTSQYLSDLERGVVGTSVLTLIKICETLQVDSDFLLFGQEDSADFTSRLTKSIQQIPEEYYDLVDQYIRILITTASRTHSMLEESQEPEQSIADIENER